VNILQTDPGKFILLETEGPLGNQTLTLALGEEESGTSFLIEANQELGGFPFIARVMSFRQKARMQKALRAATSGLTQMVEPSN